MNDATWLVGAFGPHCETARLKPEVRQRMRHAVWPTEKVEEDTTRHWPSMKDAIIDQWGSLEEWKKWKEQRGGDSAIRKAQKAIRLAAAIGIPEHHKHETEDDARQTDKELEEWFHRMQAPNVNSDSPWGGVDKKWLLPEWMSGAGRHRRAAWSAQDRAKMIMDRRWNEQSHSPKELRKQHLQEIKNNPVAKEEWASRPKDREFSGPERLPQKTLPGMGKIRGTDGRLMRGVPIDTTDPDFRRVWQMTYGQGQPVDDPGLFPDADLRYEDRGGKFDHPGLADAILEGLSKGGAGQHWSTDYDIADNYGWGIGEGSGGSGDWNNNEELPVFLDTDWNGRGEDYSRAGSGNVDYEKEIMLNRGAPLTLRDLRIPPGRDHYEDYPNEWNSILDTSRSITAALKAIRLAERVSEGDFEWRRSMSDGSWELTVRTPSGVTQTVMTGPHTQMMYY